ncbi:transcription factor S-II-domain-containing protein [Pelagophyceae sp. CCMP2097]|nr:transcription factor S-II-domain-containing protein [Pelagophyceae sp. CCMP2097]|mmetsp:Transcript_16887/g.57128  ORF Transcript_16887/g.57128 Transcript_16887/m.57128 type:complete len:310 (+) Transcript_16887:41-970(+)
MASGPREAGELLDQLNKAADAERTLEVLRALDGVSMTVATLQQLKIGAVVAKFRKHDDSAVAEMAKALIKNWKAVATKAGVATEKKPATPRGESTPREGASTPRADAAPDDPASPEDAAREPVGTGRLAFSNVLPAFRENARARFLGVLKGEGKETSVGFAVAESVELELHLMYARLADADRKREYVAKLRQLTFNLKKNAGLRLRLLRGDVDAQRLLRMGIEELATQELQKERERMAQHAHDARSLDWDKKNRDRINKSIGVDESRGMFQCGKCKSKRISNYEKQTRSADEPMTQFFECADCGNRWRF